MDYKLLTVFSDVSVKDLMYLFETSKQPLLVLTDEQNIDGLIEPYIFWRELALNKDLNTLEMIINRDYKVYSSIGEIQRGFALKNQYIIIKKDQDYYLYTQKEVEKTINYRDFQQLENTNKLLIKELEKARSLTRELRQILNASYDEIFVANAEGEVLFVSESVKKITGLPPESYLGENVRDLVERGLLVNSVTLRTMKTKKIHSAEQTYRNGITVFSTSTPIFNDDGELYRIVTNSRDISELVMIKQQLEEISSHQEKGFNKQHIAKIFYNEGMITASKKMLSVIDLAIKIAKTDSSILINGESGVGKGVLANLIHRYSEREDAPFVQVNCGAIPPSLIESELFGYVGGAFTGATKKGKEGLVGRANGGTLFLDEIGEMPLDMQVKLLHLVQEKTYTKVGGTQEKVADIRIISATNQDLSEMVKRRTFREDLYYRLHVVPLTIPPLRDRRTDILILIDYFLHKYNNKHNRNVTLDNHSRLFLQLHDYPGNVRELENLIEQIVVTASSATVSIDQLPFHGDNQEQEPQLSSLQEAVERTEEQLLKRALETYTTTRQLAEALKVSQTTIIRKLKKYKLST